MRLFQGIKEGFEEKHQKYNFYKNEIKNYGEKQRKGLINTIQEFIKQLNYILQQFSAGDIIKWVNIYIKKASANVKSQMESWIPLYGFLEYIFSIFHLCCVICNLFMNFYVGLSHSALRLQLV